ncbi:MAG: tetratricopeptide repeat protein, partial [Planctomycetota bacterium]
MADTDVSLNQLDDRPQYQMSTTWHFIKITLLVTIGVGVLTVALSPGLYLGENEDTPEYWDREAKQHVEERNFEEAIEAYEKVLSYEPTRRDIFLRAEEQIKTLEQLKDSEDAEEDDSDEESDEDTSDEEDASDEED